MGGEDRTLEASSNQQSDLRHDKQKALLSTAGFPAQSYEDSVTVGMVQEDSSNE